MSVNSNNRAINTNATRSIIINEVTALNIDIKPVGGKSNKDSITKCEVIPIPYNSMTFILVNFPL